MHLEEIYRSPGLLACQQRAFVLHAVGIESEIADHPDAFVLYVDPRHASAARKHLREYGSEAAPPTPAPAAPVHSHAWVTPYLFICVMLVVSVMAGRQVFNAHWYEVGALYPIALRPGEWWRSITALTLHADAGHLLSNLGFGALFSYLAARLLGPGIAWLCIVLGATLGNVLNAWLMPDTHVSIGASTAVFATLGLVAAYSWRQQLPARAHRFYSWAHRWAPLVVGVMLLALLGSGGENTDVLAHLTGFAIGVLFGAALGGFAYDKLARTGIQVGAATLATAAFVVAWWAALSVH